MTSNNVDEILTPEEVATMLKVNTRTIYRWLTNGTLKGVKIAGSWRIKRSDFNTLFENTKPVSENSPAG